MTAKEQLYEKMSAEHAAFIDGLKNEPPDKIIDSAYEKVFKDDILSCFEYGASFSEKQIAALLALEYPLDALYRNWLDTDVSYMDDLSDTIYSFATREAQLQNGVDDAELAETVTQSETHIAFTERIEQTMKDYANGRLSRSEQDADAIGMSEVYMYLRSGENLSDSDMQSLLRFSNPLQVVADVYSNLEGTPGIEFALNRVLDNYNGCTNGYPLADLNIKSDAQKSEVINGELSVGDWVIAAPSDEYGYLLGTVTAIDKLGTPEHGTDNRGDDIHVDFYAFDYPPERIAEIEEQFSDLYGEPKTFDELPIDDAIMAPDTLIRITELGHDEITRMGNLLQNCVAFCNCFPGAVEPQGDLHAELMARIEKNLTDYHNSMMGFGKRELIDMAGKVAAMKDVYVYMTTTHGFDDDELQFYLQFQNPLEVVADAWLERNADNEDLSFTMDFVFDKKDALVDYPLMSDSVDTSDTSDIEFVNREAKQAYNMGAAEFEKLMYGLLPDASLTAMMNWKGYASDLEANGTHTKAEFFLELFIEFDLVKQHYGEKIAMKLFDYAEHFTLNPFEVRGAANHLRDGKHISEIETLYVEGELDRTSEEWNESEQATRAFMANEDKYMRPEKTNITPKTEHEQAQSSPETPPADKKRSIGDRLAAGNEKVKAYKERKAQNPENTTKHKKEDMLE